MVSQSAMVHRPRLRLPPRSQGRDGTVPLIGLVVILLGLLAAACAPPPEPSAGRPRPPTPDAATVSPTVPERIRVGYSSTSLVILASLVAEQAGFYTAQGLDAELVQVAPQASLAALTTGELDYVLSLGSTVRAAAKGLPVRLVEASLRAPQFVLVAQADIRAGADLRGKTLGVTSLGGTNFQTAQLLVQHFGLDPQQDVQIVGVGEESQLYQALRLGRVQATPISPPFPVLAEREGYRLLVNAADVLPLPQTGVGTSVAKLDTQRAQVRRMVAAEIQGLRFVRAEREATIALIAERFQMEREVAARSYDLVLPSFSTDGRLDREGLELLLSLDQALGALDVVPPLESVADFRLVDEALALLDR